MGAVIWAIFLMVQRLTGVEDVPGWTSMMVLMLFSFGVTMVMLGILGEYIWRAFDAARNRPPFLIDEIRGFDEEKKEKKASWTADMWEDYRNANAKEKEYLKEKWGVPW